LLAAFRGELFRCFGKYRDTLAEVCDAVLCEQDRVHMAAELSLEPECRRGHGAVYKALNRRQVQVARLRWALATVPLRAWHDGRIRLAVTAVTETTRYGTARAAAWGRLHQRLASRAG
jgi:hypothetical protein